jgi:hypothetical protein
MSVTEHDIKQKEWKNAYRVSVGKPDRKRTLGIHRCRCKDNIKMNLTEIGWTGFV